MELFTATPTPPYPSFPSFSPPHSPPQYTRWLAWVKAECLLRRVFYSPMTLHPSGPCTLKSARPTPCVPSTIIVRTLCVAIVMSRLCARARFYILLCRTRHRSTMPRHLRLRTKNSLLFVTFPLILLSLSPLLPLNLVSQRGFRRPVTRCPAQLLFPERIWYLSTGYSSASRFPRRYTSFGAMAVGANGLVCGFKWQCTANATGYVSSWSQHAWTAYRLFTSTVWIYTGREAAGATFAWLF